MKLFNRNHINKDDDHMKNYAKFGQEMDAILAEIATHEEDTRIYSEKAVDAHSARLAAQDALMAKQAELTTALTGLADFIKSLTQLPDLVTNTDAAIEAERLAEVRRAEEAAAAEAKRVADEAAAAQKAIDDEFARLEAERLAKEEADAAETKRVLEETEAAAKAEAEEMAKIEAEAQVLSDADIAAALAEVIKATELVEDVLELDPVDIVDNVTTPAVNAEPDDLFGEEPVPTPANPEREIDPLTGFPKLKI